MHSYSFHASIHDGTRVCLWRAEYDLHIKVLECDVYECSLKTGPLYTYVRTYTYVCTCNTIYIRSYIRIYSVSLSVSLCVCMCVYEEFIST